MIKKKLESRLEILERMLEDVDRLWWTGPGDVSGQYLMNVHAELLRFESLTKRQLEEEKK